MELVCAQGLFEGLSWAEMRKPLLSGIQQPLSAHLFPMEQVCAQGLFETPERALVFISADPRTHKSGGSQGGSGSQKAVATIQIVKKKESTGCLSKPVAPECAI